MKKLLRSIGFVVLLLVLVWFGMLVADRKILNEELIRLHVVGNSNSGDDQQIKLLVRDAVLDAVSAGMEKVESVGEAQAYLKTHLEEIEAAANLALERHGSKDTAEVTLAFEDFPKREYDTFSLPAGIYQSLRVVIGEGSGKNWWCVVFPELCLPATTEDFYDKAVSAGFSDVLTDTLTEEDGYEIRFFLLDCLGELEKLFFRG